MATGSGPSLGAAILALVAAPVRTTKQMIRYVLSPKTGASLGAVSRQLDVKQATIRKWQGGTTSPNAESQRRIKALYERFFRINNKTRPVGDIANAKLIIKNKTGDITITGRSVNPIEIERSTTRNWKGVMAATTPEEAFEAFIETRPGIAGPLGSSPLPPVDPDYLQFEEGDYTITSS